MPQAASKSRIASRYRVYLEDRIVFGPGKAELLELIAETGSLSEAARRMEMSYNRAWLHVQTMNDCFAEPLIKSIRGGSTKGGAVLTELGTRVLQLYRQMESEAEAATTATQRHLTQLLKH